jgi:putative endonuclease
MFNYRKKVGAYGEDLAVRYLERKNYKILEKNAKISYKEIDIIAEFKGVIVFFEVKTRTNMNLGQANEAFSQRKMKNMKKAIILYFKKNFLKETTAFRLDFISIDIDKNKKTAKIRHYKEIF